MRYCRRSKVDHLFLVPILAFASCGGTPEEQTSAWGRTRLVEELRIGGVEGPAPYVFGDVSHLTLTSDGRIIVADPQVPSLRAYDGTGTYLYEIGRRGMGPGEYESIRGLGVGRGDEVVVYSLDRIVVFDADGRHARTFAVNTGGVWGIADELRVDTAGNYLVFAQRFANVVTDPRSGREIVDGRNGIRSLYLRMSPTGEIFDSLALPVPADVPSFTVWTREGYFEPFVEERVFAVSPFGYVVSGWTGDYTVYRLDRHGGRRDTVFSHPYDPVPLKTAERAAWKERAERVRARRGIQIDLPEVKPPFRDLSVDEDGRIWVHRYSEATERESLMQALAEDAPPPLKWRDIPTFDVFDGAGTYLGTVVVPSNTRILFARGMCALGVARGGFDEPYVVRFRIETEREGPAAAGCR